MLKFFFNKDHIGELVSTAKTFRPRLSAKFSETLKRLSERPLLIFSRPTQCPKPAVKSTILVQWSTITNIYHPFLQTGDIGLIMSKVTNSNGSFILIDFNGCVLFIDDFDF